MTHAQCHEIKKNVIAEGTMLNEITNIRTVRLDYQDAHKHAGYFWRGFAGAFVVVAFVYAVMKLVEMNASDHMHLV